MIPQYYLGLQLLIYLVMVHTCLCSTQIEFLSHIVESHSCGVDVNSFTEVHAGINESILYITNHTEFHSMLVIMPF